MSRLKRHPFLAFTGILLIALVALVAFRLAGPGAKGEVRKERVISVGTMLPIQKDLEVRLIYTADIQPYQQINVYSRVDGYIAKIHVDKGDFVKANELLVEIDHTDYVHAVNRAKANLAAARADVIRQEANIRNAKVTLERTRMLIKDQFISQQDVDNAQATYDVAIAQIESLRAQVHQMEVALQQAETNLTYSYIRAPFPGSISVRNLDAGAFVSGSTGSTSTLSRGILILQDITTVPRRIEQVLPAAFSGTITRVVHALDRNTRTMTVEVDLANPDRALKGGMFARVEMIVGTHPNALQIPIDAVTRLETDQYVYTVKDGKAHKVPVTLGAQHNQLIEIIQGLTPADPVIVSGKDLVGEGARVDPKPLDQPSAPASPPSTPG